jgi:hypothetical protein
VLSFFAGEVIKPFALVMSFGIVVGTFSSIYVASPLLLWIEGRAAKHTHWTEDPAAGEWTVAQVLIDPGEANDWEVIDKLTLTAGGRVQNEKVSYTFQDIQNGNAYFSGDAEDTATTYKFSPQYQITPDLMVFATYATGYKGQTYDLTTGFNANRAAAGPIKPEKSTDTEVGARSQFFDRVLTLNLTYFDTDYEDLQAQTIETLADADEAPPSDLALIDPEEIEELVLGELGGTALFGAVGATRAIVLLNCAYDKNGAGGLYSQCSTRPGFRRCSDGIRLASLGRPRPIAGEPGSITGFRTRLRR